MLFRTNLLLERAKADVRKAPPPALRLGRAMVAQATAGSRTGRWRVPGVTPFFLCDTAATSHDSNGGSVSAPVMLVNMWGRRQWRVLAD